MLRSVTIDGYRSGLRVAVHCPLSACVAAA